MPSSQPIPIPETPALVIDTSSPVVFVGLLGTGGTWLAQNDCQGAVLETLFASVESILSSARLELEDCRGYLYCEGPGSMLGLRLNAMAMETWSWLYPASASYFAFNSLQLAAALMTLDYPDMMEALLVSDWKKDAWNAVSIKDGQPGAIDVINHVSLTQWTGPLFHLPQRKGWQQPPKEATRLDYQPQRLPEVINHSGILRPTEGIELYRSGMNTFRKWIPDRHRAPPH